jgi:uncharacterized DUF497 family protein
VQFDWDSKKASQNLRKHGISFDEAVTVFYDPLSATFEDDNHSISEYRYITIGLSSGGRLLVVAHADFEDGLRIISARLASAHERRKHEEKGH